MTHVLLVVVIASCFFLGGCAFSFRIIDVVPIDQSDMEDNTPHLFCNPPRGEEQAPEQRSHGQAYNSMESGCI